MTTVWCIYSSLEPALQDWWWAYLLPWQRWDTWPNSVLSPHPSCPHSYWEFLQLPDWVQCNTSSIKFLYWNPISVLLPGNDIQSTVAGVLGALNPFGHLPSIAFELRMASTMCRFFYFGSQSVCWLAIPCTLATHTHTLRRSVLCPTPFPKVHPCGYISWPPLPFLFWLAGGCGQEEIWVIFFLSLYLLACLWQWLPPSMAPDRQSLLPDPAHPGLHKTIDSYRPTGGNSNSFLLSLRC